MNLLGALFANGSTKSAEEPIYVLKTLLLITKIEGNTP